MTTAHSNFAAISQTIFVWNAILVLLLFVTHHRVNAQDLINVTEGKYTYRPVVKNNRILWFENQPGNKTVDRVSLFLYDDGKNKLISKDVSVLFPGWPDLDDEGNVAYVKNLGTSHEVFFYEGHTFKQTQITNNPAIKNSKIDMGLGNDKTYTGYVRIHGGDVVFKNRLGHIFLYQQAKGIRQITTAPEQVANLGDDDPDKGATGVAVPGGAHVKYYEFDGKHIVWMHEDRRDGNNSKVSIYMAQYAAKPAENFKPRLITSFDAWVPNDKAVLIGKLWNPFFMACDGKIVWQYYLPSKPLNVAAGGILSNLKKDYGADLDDVRVGYYDGNVREISRGTAVAFQSVRILNGKIAWSQTRKEGEGKNVKEFKEVILYGANADPIVASYPERPKQGKLKQRFWDSIVDVEIVGEEVFWVMGQSECFEHFKMPITNQLYCMYQSTNNIGFFHQRSGTSSPFKTMNRQSFAGSGELDRGLYAFFKTDANNAFVRDINAVNVAGGGDSIYSSDFLTVVDLKKPDQRKLRSEEKEDKHISDAFSINFDLLAGCGDAAGLSEVTIETITLDVLAEKSPSARIMDIESVAIYADENRNGQRDAGDQVVAQSYGLLFSTTLTILDGGIKIEKNKPRHFVVEMKIRDEVCPCGKYTIGISGAKLGIKNTAGGGKIRAGGKTTGSLILPEATVEALSGDEQAGLPGQKLPENLAVVVRNFPVRCGQIKFTIATQPFGKGAAILSGRAEAGEEVTLDLTQSGKDATAQIGFQLGKDDGLYTVRASIVTPPFVVCENNYYIFREHAGKMVVQVIDLNNPDYYTAVQDNSNPDFTTWKTTMTGDTDKLSIGGEGREGALADGASPLLIRAKLVGFTEPPPGNIDITISGSSNIGHLSRGLGETIPAYDGGSSISVQWVKTRTGVYGFALYTPPKNFGYNTAPRRSVHLKTSYALSGAPEPLVNEQDLTLMKPPVAFIHGLWSGMETWGIPYTRHTSQYEVHFIDYSHLNSRSFAELGAEVHLGIREITRKLRLRKIAATRVNIVGHSMGGLVARQFFADEHGKRFFRKDNFGKGDIYKLITLGTPHFGSPDAYLLVKLRDRRFSPILSLARARGIDIEGGAIDALCPDSPDIRALGVTHIPTNTVRAWNFDSRTNALTWDDFIQSMPPRMGNTGSMGFLIAALKYTAVAGGSIFMSDHFSSDRTDMLVTLESQSGGIAQGANNVFAKTIHFDTGSDLTPDLYSETISEYVAVHIFDTLNRDYDDINYYAPRLPAPQVQDPTKVCRQR